MYHHSIRCCAFFTILLTLSLRAYEQSQLTGTVRSKQGPVAGASVSLKGSLSGTTTDSSGSFSFSTGNAGPQVLIVSSIGFRELQKPLVLSSNQKNENLTLHFNLILQQDDRTLEPVVISAGSFIASDKARGASLSPIDVVTTAGNGGDIANALRTLPGTQQIGEQEGLFVRGGTSDETKQFIDGTLFRDPNFSTVPGILQPARVSPFLFNGIVFSSGGYSALYGEAMSGALILESVDLPDKSSAIIGASPLVGVAGFQELDRNNRYSYGINSRYVNYNPYSKVIKQQPDYFHGPEFLSGDANFRLKTGKSGMLKYYVTAGYNYTGLRRPDIDSTLLKTGFRLKGVNVYNNVSYRGPLGNNWKIDLGATYTYNKDDIGNQLLSDQNKLLQLQDYPYSQKNNRSVIRSGFAEGKLVLTHKLAGGHVLRFGGGDMYSNDHYSYNDTVSILTDHLLSAFAETDLRVTRHIAVKLGARYEYSQLLRQPVLAPRVSIGYRVPDIGQFNAAYGIFYQKPENQFIHQSSGLIFSRAEHYLLNYLRSSGNRTFRLEVYYKLYTHLPKLSADSLYTNSGDGYARGIELFWRDKRTFKGLDYWVTYTYLDTKRNYLNFPYRLNPNFATPHTASVVVKRFFDKINTSFNAAYTFSTGRPYYHIVDDHPGKGLVEDQGKTVDYNSVNLSVAYLCSLFRHWKNKDFTIIAFGMNNVLGTNQVFGYNYSNNGLNKVPITLPAPRSLFIGVFMNLGIDRRDDFNSDNL